MNLLAKDCGRTRKCPSQTLNPIYNAKDGTFDSWSTSLYSRVGLLKKLWHTPIISHCHKIALEEGHMVQALYLNRSVHHGQYTSKNTIHMQFPKVLDLTPYTTSGTSSSAAGGSSISATLSKTLDT